MYAYIINVFAKPAHWDQIYFPKLKKKYQKMAQVSEIFVKFDAFDDFVDFVDFHDFHFDVNQTRLGTDLALVC